MEKLVEWFENNKPQWAVTPRFENFLLLAFGAHIPVHKIIPNFKHAGVDPVEHARNIMKYRVVDQDNSYWLKLKPKYRPDQVVDLSCIPSTFTMMACQIMYIQDSGESMILESTLKQRTDIPLMPPLQAYNATLLDWRDGTPW